MLFLTCCITSMACCCGVSELVGRLHRWGGWASLPLCTSHELCRLWLGLWPSWRLCLESRPLTLNLADPAAAEGVPPPLGLPSLDDDPPSIPWLIMDHFDIWFFPFRGGGIRVMATSILMGAIPNWCMAPRSDYGGFLSQGGPGLWPSSVSEPRPLGHKPLVLVLHLLKFFSTLHKIVSQPDLYFRPLFFLLSQLGKFFSFSQQRFLQFFYHCQLFLLSVMGRQLIFYHWIWIWAHLLSYQS